MAPRHWQIIKHETSSGRVRYGRSETVPLEEAPSACLDVDTRAANLIGDSLYGVDLKPANGGWVVIEVNDNPSIDHGIEVAQGGVPDHLSPPPRRSDPAPRVRTILASGRTPPFLRPPPP